MTQSNLNHECLVKVLAYVYDLNDLINCFYVCKLWNGAVKERLNRAEHLISFDHNFLHNGILHPNTINLDPVAILSEYENGENLNDPSHRFTLKYLGSHLTPNIKIVILDNLFYSYNEEEDRFRKLNERLRSEFHRATSSLKQIKGSNHLGSCLLTVDCVNNLESFSICSFQFSYLKGKNVRYDVDFSAGKLKQLECDLPIFIKHAQHLKNLKFLYLHIHKKDPIPSDLSFPNLEILMIKTNIGVNFPFRGFAKSFELGFNILRISPKVKSIYFLCLGDYDFIGTQAVEVHQFPNVEDLVIFTFENVDVNWPWSTMKNFLEHFPNLKHFALRWNSIIKNKHIEELIQLLPQLAVLDLRDCQFISHSVERFIHDYNTLHKTKIKIYISHHLYAKSYDTYYILSGTNFMDTYFYRIPLRFPMYVDFN